MAIKSNYCMKKKGKWPQRHLWLIFEARMGKQRYMRFADFRLAPPCFD